MEATWWLAVDLTAYGDVKITLVDVIGDRLDFFLPMTFLQPPLGTLLCRRKTGLGEY